MGVSDKYLVWLVKGLAVIGGAAVGGLALGLLLRVAGKWLSPRDVPKSAIRIVRLMGAVISGWLVWILVSTPGGSGLLGGGSGSLLGGAGTNTAADKDTPTTEKKSPSTEPARRDREQIQIIMRGGPRMAKDDERFYRLEGETEPKNQADVKSALKDLQMNHGLKGIEILIYEDSVASAHPKVTELQRWAETNGLKVKLSKLPGDAP